MAVVAGLTASEGAACAGWDDTTADAASEEMTEEVSAAISMGASCEPVATFRVPV